MNALRSRAAQAGLSLDDYAEAILFQIADADAGNVPVVVEVERRDFDDLNGFVNDLLADDPDAVLLDEMRKHLSTCIMALADESRERGGL